MRRLFAAMLGFWCACTGAQAQLNPYPTIPANQIQATDFILLQGTRFTLPAFVTLPIITQYVQNQLGSLTLTIGTTPISGGSVGQFLSIGSGGKLQASNSSTTIAFPQTVTGGTSGGIPYFASTSSMASSALLTAGQIMVGGGAGAAPSTVAMGGDCTFSSPSINCTKTGGTPFSSLATLAPGSGVTTVLQTSVGSAGSMLTNGGALGTPSSGSAANLTSIPVANATGILPIVNGGTGSSSPALTAGSGITISGTWPNNTITASGSATINVGTTTVTGTCSSGQFIYNNAGTTGCTSSSATITLPQAVSGTVNSGGVPYFATTGSMASSAALAANALVVGGGAGNPPATVTLGGDCTFSSPNVTCTKTNGSSFGSLATLTPGTGVATALAVNTGTAGSMVVNGGALGTPSSGSAANLTNIPMSNATGTLAIANGGTGTASPGLVAGTNVTITGSWPNQTVTAATGAPQYITPRIVTGTTDAPTGSDSANIVEYTGAGGAVTITLNTGVTDGTNITLVQTGTNAVHLAAGAGATLHTANSWVYFAGQYSTVQCYYRTSTTTWLCSGGLSPS